jgi:hypothetical protein
MRIRTIYPRTMTKSELNVDSLVGGNVGAIKKALQRLEKRGLISAVTAPGGKREKNYQAVLSHTRGEVTKPVPPNNNPSPGTDLRGDKRGDNSSKSETCPPYAVEGDNTPGTMPVPPSCPPPPPSGGAESGLGGQSGAYPPAREAESERTREELDTLSKNAWNQWDV